MDERSIAVVQIVIQGLQFFRWVLQTAPDLERQVAADQETLACVPEDGSPAHLAVRRDAANRLCGLATQGGFEPLASLYYQDYESACIRLAGHAGGDASYA